MSNQSWSSLFLNHPAYLATKKTACLMGSCFPGVMGGGYCLLGMRSRFFSQNKINIFEYFLLIS